MLFRSGGIRWLILGIGIDVNFQAADLSPELRPIATSLRIELGRPVHRADLAAALLMELDRDRKRIEQGEFEAVASEWEALCGTLGNEVSISQGTRVIEGRAEALDPEGALLVRTEHGRLERILGGDVSLRKREPAMKR